jgi:hypothetical protein
MSKEIYRNDSDKKLYTHAEISEEEKYFRCLKKIIG